MLLIIIGILILGLILIVFQRLKAKDNNRLFFMGLSLLTGALLILPFYDPLKMRGFLASIIMDEKFPSPYFTIVGLVIINICLIYTIHMFLSTMLLKHAMRFKNKVIYSGFYTKMRHPIFASSCVIALAYFVIMGSIVGVICSPFIMIFLHMEAGRQEKEMLIPKFEDDYLIYMRKVPSKLFNSTIGILIVILYAIFFIGIVGILSGI